MPPRKPSTVGRHRKKPDPLAKRVGQRIRRLRKERDFDWDSWIESSGLGRGTVSEVERGLIAPGLHALAKMAAALELTISDLVLGGPTRERIFEHMRELSPADGSHLLAHPARLAA